MRIWAKETKTWASSWVMSKGHPGSYSSNKVGAFRKKLPDGAVSAM